MNNILVWSEPLARGDLKIAPGDINDAISSYIAATGERPLVIMLNRKNERYQQDIPADIMLVIRPGIMLGEVWMSMDYNVDPNKLAKEGGYVAKEATEEFIKEPSQSEPAKRQGVSKIRHHKNPTGNYETYPDEYQGRGRPRKSGEVSRTTDWRRRKEIQLRLAGVD